MLLKKGYVYICGDAANMAREVHATLIQIVAEQRGISNEKAEEVIKSMRSANQYQVRVHPATYFPARRRLLRNISSCVCSKRVADFFFSLTGGCLVIEDKSGGGGRAFGPLAFFFWILQHCRVHGGGEQQLRWDDFPGSFPPWPPGEMGRLGENALCLEAIPQFDFQVDLNLDLMPPLERRI